MRMQEVTSYIKPSFSVIQTRCGSKCMLLTLDISVLRKKKVFSNWESHLMLAPEAFQELMSYSYNQVT